VEELLKNEKEKDAEIERLKVLLKNRMYELEELNELKALLGRAADALVSNHIGFDDVSDLVKELRKAAQ
jgi:hypothetical protein